MSADAGGLPRRRGGFASRERERSGSIGGNKPPSPGEGTRTVRGDERGDERCDVRGDGTWRTWVGRSGLV